MTVAKLYTLHLEMKKRHYVRMFGVMSTEEAMLCALSSDDICNSLRGDAFQFKFAIDRDSMLNYAEVLEELDNRKKEK